MKLGSLFDGAGGFPLAAQLVGISTAWTSEIEPFCLRIEKKNFPNTKQLGDIKDINGAEIEPVDIISFGSPCQDLSVGKAERQGLKGERSGLFFEAIRVVKEMRDATQGQHPNIIIYENVTGIFSSNGGEDFRTVLNEIGGVAEKGFCVPRLEKWTHAGEILADGFNIAWRTLDARYWGLPTSRKRCFVVGCFGNNRSAGQILFERKGLQRDFDVLRKGWQTSAEDSKGCVNYIFENHRQDNRYRGPLNYAVGIDAHMGTGGNNVPFCVKTFRKVSRAQNSNDASTWEESNIANTLNTFDMGEVRCSELIVTDRVRRLTPLECGRLMGFPDYWCKDVKGSDNAQYRMWGNSVAIPCVLYIMEGIAEKGDTN